MTSSRTLKAEDRVAHYRVVGPLGAGGMGEVYLAQDQKLERNVALKVLPPELVRSQDRVRRFVQEAKSASSLNHPNIITIYEIGEERVTSDAGESSDAVRYISMELVNGKTLSTKIHEEKTDLRTLLGYLAQAAEGVAKAHAAGIVHRDLKPGNIMVTDDGFAKVLDFGLAKLTERQGPDLGATATAMTVPADQTADGMIMGTVNYMSPEQVQGKTVDHRSDVFSFGCILYEAATRHRPFTADSSVETMHKILHDNPPPIEDFNAAIPNELRRLVRRCLQKSPDQRLQSMKDLALEVREIVDEFDELSNSGTAAASGSGLAMQPGLARRVPLIPVVVIGALILAGAVYWGMRGGSPGQDEAPHSSLTVRFSTVTRTGLVGQAAISKDGRYVAYLQGEGGGVSMRVHQVATSADLEVIPSTDVRLASPAFSPDGNYLYYTAVKPSTPRYRTLYRIPSLGGQAEERGFDVDSPVTFSPDGEQLAFVRYATGGAGTVQIMATSGGEAREVVRIEAPEQLVPQLSWSPDGKTLALATFTPPPDTEARVMLLDVETEAISVVFRRSPAFMSGAAWSPDGRGLIATGVDAVQTLQPQVYSISYPDGKLRRVTNDVNSYSQPTVSQDGAIAVIRQSTQPDLWSVDPGSGERELMVRSTSPENTPHAVACGEDFVAYALPWEKESRLYTQAIGSDSSQLVSTGGGLIVNMVIRDDTIFLIKFDPEGGSVGLWAVGVDGTGLRRVTDSAAFELQVDPEGRYVAYLSADNDNELWVQSLESGAPRLLTDKFPGRSGFFTFSPDGSRVLAGLNDTSEELVKTIYTILPVEEGSEAQVVTRPDNGAVRGWIPGEENLYYLDTNDPQRNLWRLPLDGEAPTPITGVTEGQLVSWRWSSDDRQLALVVRTQDGDSLFRLEKNSLEAKKTTSFPGINVFNMMWLGNSSRIVVAAGPSASDVVLIRNFQ